MGKSRLERCLDLMSVERKGMTRTVTTAEYARMRLLVEAAADLRDEVWAEQRHPNVLADGTVDTLRLALLRARLKAALEAIRG